MKRSAACLTVLVMLCSTLAIVPEAWARAGGGGSRGSRGSRSYTAPARPAPTPSSPATPAAPTSPTSVRPPAPQRSGWSGLMGGLGGFMLGGLLGGLLFGGLFRGLGGGFGLMDLLILGVLAYLAYSWFKRRQAQPAGAPGYASASGYGAPPAWAERAAPAAPQPQPASAAATAMTEPATGDLARGLDHIRQVDAAFDPLVFAERATEIFRDVQGAWTRQDLSVVSGVLTPEMLDEMQKDTEAFRAQGKVNHLDRITVQGAEVTEAWQEKGQDFVTVRFQATLLDYTTDQHGKVVEGNPTEPITFDEYWTFTRPVWAKSWRLTAIQQPAGR